MSVVDQPGSAVGEAVEAEAADVAALRAGARAWLAEHWSPDGDRKAFVAAAIDAGWAAPSWPSAWFGKDASPDASKAVREEFAAVRAPGAGQDLQNLWANTVLAFGSDDMKRRFVRPLLLNEVKMCLLYSEPGAGSDLAGVTTTAVRDGDEWIVNGQKVWTSGGQVADFGMLICRTDWDQPKHKGLSFFFLPMKQDGVEVRPLRQCTGDRRFNEVFLTNARVSDANRLGTPGDGWRVLQTALAYERLVMGDTRPTAVRDDRTPDERVEGPPPDTVLVELARERGRTGDPVVRDALMRLHVLRTVNTWNGLRAKAQLAQGTSSPVASLGKLAMSRILHTAGSLQQQILGADGMLGGADGPADRNWHAMYDLHNAFFTSIGGGTDQIQRNIIGERLLGLPREPEPDKVLPFSQTKRNQ
jgi:alkylation response protein AidB-like acyl-CoA dehydrogenase